MNIAVCENSETTAQQVSYWIQQYGRLYHLPVNVQIFLSAKEFSNWNEPISIAYIAFGGDIGFLQARLLRERNRHCRIILADDTTAFAIQSIRIHCSDFIQKPVQFHQIVHSMNLAMGGRL